MHQDGVSETISHFIGLFDMHEEAARLRHGYEQFRYENGKPLDPPLPEPMHPAPRHALELAPNHPIIRYQPAEDSAHIPNAPLHAASPVLLAEPPRIDLSPIQIGMLPEAHGGSSEAGPAPLTGPVPGSVALLAVQAISLVDNDVVVIGEVSGPMPDYAPDTSGVQAMLAEIGMFTGALSDAAPSGIFHSIPEFMAGAADAAHAMAGYGGGALDVASATGADTKGIHVDGKQADAMPSLDDVLPNMAQEDTPVTTGSVSLTSGDNTMVVATGQNHLTNQASIFDASLAPGIVAVAGDHVRLDVIAQINAYADNDTVDPAFAGTGTGAGNISHNLAEFASVMSGAGASGEAADLGTMPANWTVSVFEGDLVFLEWITQYSFATDNDLLVLTATGSTTNIETGANAGINDTSFSDLGLFYDIVIIGGNLYDANLICQTNVLYDNDTLQMLCAGDADGSLSTSDNLLWNEASITRHGADAATGPMPSHYLDAMQRLESGERAMPEGFGNDAALSGLGHLRVLYVTGNVFDLQLAQQTNVLTDADHVAVYARGLLEHKDSAWDVSTGQNALVNMASITDYASAGDMLYVNGGTYSDAVLVQADLVDTAPQVDGGLASELVAFLDTEPALQSLLDHHAAPAAFDAAPAPADIMQSVLA